MFRPNSVLHASLCSPIITRTYFNREGVDWAGLLAVAAGGLAPLDLASLTLLARGSLAGGNGDLCNTPQPNRIQN